MAFDNTTPPGSTATPTNRSIMTGMFRDPDAAERAYSRLAEKGYTRDDINLIMNEETRKRLAKEKPDTEVGSKALEGAGVGGAIGGTLGALGGAVAAVGTSLAIPGLGLVVAGPVAAALAGAGAGGLTGGLIGGLVGAGIPEERAKHYEQGVKEGGIVLGVRPKNEEDARYFENEWKNLRGEHIYR